MVAIVNGRTPINAMDELIHESVSELAKGYVRYALYKAKAPYMPSVRCMTAGGMPGATMHLAFRLG